VSTVLTAAGLTHVGLMRDVNEDCFHVSEIGGGLRRGPEDVVERLASEGGFALGVYDGAGGHGGGDDASRIAAQKVGEALGGVLPSGPAELCARLVDAVVAAGEAILEASHGDPAWRGIGSTATVAASRGRDLVVAQVGDSRAYVLRRRTLVQVTRDDTLLQEALRSGTLLPSDAASFPHRNVLIQALGTGIAPKVGVTVLSARRGDVLLLCTDGVHGQIDDAVLRATLLRHREPGVAARVLRDEALHAGGSDNLALVIARFDGEGLPHPDEADVLEDRSFRVPG